MRVRDGWLQGLAGAIVVNGGWRQLKRKCATCGRAKTRLLSFALQLQQAEIRPGFDPKSAAESMVIEFEQVANLRVTADICPACACNLAGKLDKAIDRARGRE